MKKCIHSSVVSTLIVLGFTISTVSGGWTSVAVGGGETKIVIGEGRNDGITRVYSSSGDFWRYLNEYSWAQGAWNMVEIDSVYYTGCPAAAPAIGVARTESVKRIYLGGHEFTYSVPSWNYSRNFGVGGYDLKLLAGRNDGVNRLYVAGGSGFMHESTWVPNTTSYSDLAMPSAASTIHHLDFGAARNDGVQRLYGVTSGGQLSEWSYEGGWTIATKAFGIGEMFDLAIGSARGDGVNRIYMTCADGHAYEVSWNGTTWTPVSMGFGTLAMTAVAMGDARGDGVPSVVVGNEDGRIYEFRFQNGNWAQNLIVQSTGAVQAITIGAGRGDGVKRLYVAQGGNLKEYTYTPTTSTPFAAQILPNGILEWSSVPGGVYDVEWSSDLTTWRSDWSSLTGIPATGTSTQKPIPRFFRVKQRTE